MQLKYSKAKRRKVFTFSVGNIVSVRIPRIDRTSTDLYRAPCIVVEVLGKEYLLYRLRCCYGVLKTCYGEGDLECYDGMLPLEVNGWKNDKVISLREAAQLVNPKNDLKCGSRNCQSGCNSKRCYCTRINTKCLSKCHGGKTCADQLAESEQCCDESVMLEQSGEISVNQM